MRSRYNCLYNLYKSLDSAVCHDSLWAYIINNSILQYFYHEYWWPVSTLSYIWPWITLQKSHRSVLSLSNAKSRYWVCDHFKLYDTFLRPMCSLVMGPGIGALGNTESDIAPLRNVRKYCSSPRLMSEMFNLPLLTSYVCVILVIKR